MGRAFRLHRKFHTDACADCTYVTFRPRGLSLVPLISSHFSFPLLNFLQTNISRAASLTSPSHTQSPQLHQIGIPQRLGEYSDQKAETQNSTDSF